MASLLMVALTGVLLWHRPLRGGMHPSGQATMRLRWTAVPSAAPVRPAAVLAGVPDSLPGPSVRSQRQSAYPGTPRPETLPAGPSARPDTPLPAARSLLDAQGRPRLPAGTRDDGLAHSAPAQRLFRDLPVIADAPQRGVFERHAAASQGTLDRWIHGQDIQHAKARPAPSVAFDPRLHERPADLARAGDAQPWLSAPIREQVPPDLAGGATALLVPRRQALADVMTACRVPASRQAWQALDIHLAALARAEQRFVRGSGVIEREHGLPAEVHRQFNLARRLLWWLEEGPGRCSSDAV